MDDANSHTAPASTHIAPNTTGPAAAVMVVPVALVVVVAAAAPEVAAVVVDLDFFAVGSDMETQKMRRRKKSRRATTEKKKEENERQTACSRCTARGRCPAAKTPAKRSGGGAKHAKRQEGQTADCTFSAAQTSNFGAKALGITVFPSTSLSRRFCTREKIIFSRLKCSREARGPTSQKNVIYMGEADIVWEAENREGRVRGKGR